MEWTIERFRDCELIAEVSVKNAPAQIKTLEWRSSLFLGLFRGIGMENTGKRRKIQEAAGKNPGRYPWLPPT